jgi:hypothetical protein
MQQKSKDELKKHNIDCNNAKIDKHNKSSLKEIGNSKPSAEPKINL